jgi:hypothetical protein
LKDYYNNNDDKDHLNNDRGNKSGQEGLRYEDSDVESKEIKYLEKNEKLFTSHTSITKKKKSDKNRSQESTGNTHVDNIRLSRFEVSFEILFLS